MKATFVFLVLFIVAGTAIDLPPNSPLWFGVPTVRTLQSSELLLSQAAVVDVPLPASASASLSLLSDGFLCPTADLCDGSAAAAAAGGCACDFTQPCQALPACCAAAYPLAWSELCAADAEPAPAWQLLTPGDAVEVTALRPPGAYLPPHYFRYQPSAEARCRGFGFEVVPPVASANSTLVFAVNVHVSLGTAYPELHPDVSWTVHWSPSSTWENGEHARFCPASAASRSMASDLRGYYLGAANEQTVFVAVQPSLVDAAGLLVDSPFRLRLVESNDGRLQTMQHEAQLSTGCSSDPQLAHYPCIAAGQSVWNNATAAATSVLLYEHAADQPSCASLTVDLRPADVLANGGTRFLMVRTAERPTEPDSDFYFFATHMTFSTGAKGLSLFVCPGDSYLIGVERSAGGYVLSLSTSAPVLVRRLATDVNPLYLAATLSSTARMLCSQATFLSRFVLPTTQEYSYRCTSWWGVWFDNCRQFFQLGMVDRPALVWPPPPDYYRRYADYLAVNASVMAADGYPVVYNGSSYNFAVVLDAVRVSPDSGSQTPLKFFTPDQLRTCRVEFLNRLFNPDTGQLLTGLTQPIQFTSSNKYYSYQQNQQQNHQQNQQQNHQQNQHYERSTDYNWNCSSDVLRQRHREVLDSIAVIPDLSSSEQPARLLQLDLIASEETALCQALLSTYTQPSSQIVGQRPSDGQCDFNDPCCPLHGLSVQMYDVCLSTASVTIVGSELNASRADVACGDVACVEALYTEYSQFSSYIVGEPVKKCAANADLERPIAAQLRRYANACRARYVGAKDAGLPCNSVADCPGADSGRVVCALSSSNRSAVDDGRTTRRCLADTAYWDEQIFACLLDEMPPVLEQYLRRQHSDDLVPGTPLSESPNRELLWSLLSTPMCGSVDPDDLLPYLPLTFQYVIDECVVPDACPSDIHCVTNWCDVPYTCFDPWTNCVSGWVARSARPLSAAACASQLRCNVYAPGSGAPTVCHDDDSCRAACGVDTSFCGYCDAETGRCLEIAGVTSEAECRAIGTACYFAGGQQLVTATAAGAACGQLGNCDVHGGGGLMTRDECEARTLCSFQSGVPPLLGNACQSGPDFGWPVCGYGGVGVASGCLWLPPATLRTQDNCTGPTEVYPPRPYQWLPAADSPQQCLDNDALKLCFDADQPWPTAYSASVCRQRGGDHRSPYTFQRGVFTPGASVPLTWQARRAVARARYLVDGRLDYVKLSGLFGDVVAGFAVSDSLSRSRCSFDSPEFNVLLGVACLCTGDSDSGACARLSEPAVHGMLSPTAAAQTQLCQALPVVLDAPPVLLETDANFSLSSPLSASYCADVNLSYASAGRWLAPRTRLRGTSFYLSRQDTDIAPLAVLSADGGVVGTVLSDGVLLSPAAGTTLQRVRLCIQLRPDFAAYVQNNCSCPRLVRRLTFGVASADYQQVNPWYELPAAAVSVRYVVDVPANASVYETLQLVRYVCADIAQHSAAERVFFAISTDDQPAASSNGFSSEQNDWMTATGACYLLPVVFLLLALLALLATGAASELSSLPALQLTCVQACTAAALLLGVFFLLRACLLFLIVTGAVAINSTAEFALYEFGQVFQFAALSLVSAYILALIWAQLHDAPVSFRRPVAAFAALVLLLCLLLVAFLVAFDTAPADDGISNTMVTCRGRIADGASSWTTRRVLRFAYSAVVASFAIAMGAFLTWLVWQLHSENKGKLTKLNRVIVASIVAAVALTTHSIVALCLLGTGYNDFAFELSMLWVTEIVPFAFWLVFVFVTMVVQIVVRSDK